MYVVGVFMAKTWSDIWKMEELYRSVERWMIKVGSRSGSKATKSNYLYRLRSYCEKIGNNPDELIEERKKHLSSSDEHVKRQHEEILMKYFNGMSDNSTRSNAVGHFKTIKSFYKANYVDLKADTPRTWTTMTDRVPSIEDIKKMVDVSKSPLERAVLLFSAQSGQRVGIVTAMTYGMFREALNNGESPIDIHVSGDIRGEGDKRINKNRLNYTFFVGADTINALKTYIEHMRVIGYTYKDDSPLFVSDRKFRRFAGTKDKKATFARVDREAMNKIIRRCAVSAGLMDKEGIVTPGGTKRYPIHFHCMRKFWQTAMEQAGIAKPWYEFMMGHSLGELDRAYSRPTVEQLRDAYTRAESYMNISRLNIPDLDRLKKDMMLSLIRQQCQLVGFDPTRIAINKKDEIGEDLTIDQEIEVLQQVILEVTMKKKVENNNHEHKVVTEDDLTDYLNKGWEMVSELSNGKIVLKSPFPNGVK